MINSKNYWLKKSKIINWKKNPKVSYTYSTNKKYRFYEDGKLNLSYNCVDNNISKGLGKKTAVIIYDKNFISEKLTYIELLNAINIFYKYFKKKIKNNKDIIVHSPASKLTILSMLTFPRHGIPFSVIFEELEIEAIIARIKLIKPQIFITSKNLKFKKKLLSKLKKEKINLMIISLTKIKLDKILNKKIEIYEKLKYFKANKKLFTLFTSGSTGAPKGIVHSTGPYLVYAKMTCIEKFGLDSDSIILTASDAGWINGHTYAIYGPLSIGATSIILEQPKMILFQSFFEKLLQQISVLYLPVTLIRLLKSIYNSKKKYKNLKSIGSMGEPLAQNISSWYAKKFCGKDVPVVNTYFQTETGGIISSHGYNDNLKFHSHGSVGTRLSSFIKFNKETNFKKKFEIEIITPWPGMMINIINGKKYFERYFNKKNFKLYDSASYDNKKNLLIHGRSDDVMNIRGHRIGSGEIESILLKLKFLKEVSVISIPDYLEGEVVVVYVSVNKKFLFSESKVKEIIIKYFGTYALPRDIIVLSELPKTRSGKIMRRILRDIYLDPSSNVGDISTLLDPLIVIEIKKKLSELR